MAQDGSGWPVWPVRALEQEERELCVLTVFHLPLVQGAL